jgi:NAD kinase
MSNQIVLFGGSFNPPGVHHRQITEALAARFDEVVVIPCGPRPDKVMTQFVDPCYRAAMCDMTFTGILGVTVDLSDLELGQFTPTWELDQRFEPRGDVWHVIGTDLLEVDDSGLTVIERAWYRGKELFEQKAFVVVSRQGVDKNKVRLPKRYQWLDIEVAGSSSVIRQKFESGDEVEGLMFPLALAYAKRYGLYRMVTPASSYLGKIDLTHGELQYDIDASQRAKMWIDRLKSSHQQVKPVEYIVVVGGDGVMLRKIRHHWQRRLPLIGLNAGNLGFLMNAPELFINQEKKEVDVIYRVLPMLYVEMTRVDGSVIKTYGFNDAWMERSTSQSAWVEVTVNQQNQMPKVICDGMLVSTAAGSTAYARSMGATPLPAHTPAWLLVGSNVMEPISWKHAMLSPETEIDIINLSPEKRPTEAFVDGLSQGEVISMRARLSRTASVEMIFSASGDLADKITKLQFGGK